jgi:hypothetical protein
MGKRNDGAAKSPGDAPVIDGVADGIGTPAEEEPRRFGRRRGKVLKEAIDKGGEPGKSNLPDF